MFNLTDTELIEKIIDKDKEAGRILFLRYSDQIHYYIQKRISPSDASKDLLQTTFLKAFKNIKKLKNKSIFKSWLYTIARNVIFDYYNKNKNDLVFDEVDYKIGKQNKDSVLNEELEKDMSKAIKKLSNTQQKVIKLRVFKENKFKEIASELNISENSAKVTYHNAIKKLKKHLERDYE
jgi:RNA polymerase sigma-70 factor (ECF subfamily)